MRTKIQPKGRMGGVARLLKGIYKRGAGSWHVPEIEIKRGG